MSAIAMKSAAVARYVGVAAAATLLWLNVAVSGLGAAPKIGEAAPELIVAELDGPVFDLAKLKGNVVLVNYWATWCAPCKKDLPKLDAFYRRYHSRNLDVIGISVDRLSDLPKVRKVMTSLAYPVALLEGITVDGFGVPEGVPVTWIVDSKGEIRDMMIEVRDELLNALVVPLLSP